MPTSLPHWNFGFHLVLLIFVAFTQCVQLKCLFFKPTFVSISLNGLKNTRLNRVSLMFEGNDRHDLLRHLYINREKIFRDKEVAEHLKNYFGLTLENLEQHVIDTMEEQIRDRDATRDEKPIWVDAKVFKGAPEKFKLPLDPTLSLLKEEGIQDIKEVEGQEFISDFDKTIYELLQNARANCVKRIPQTELEKFIELYSKVGSYEYEIVDNELYYYTDCQPLKRIKLTDQHEKRQHQIELMSRPTRNPSFIDPVDPHIRTGRQRALQRKRDSGLHAFHLGALQKKRWKMEVPPEEDIPRGKSIRGHPIIQKFVDSMDFERQLSNAQDTNYFKR